MPGNNAFNSCPKRWIHAKVACMIVRHLVYAPQQTYERIPGQLSTFEHADCDSCGHIRGGLCGPICTRAGQGQTTPQAALQDSLCVAIKLPLYQTHLLHCLGLNLILTTILEVAVRFILRFFVIIRDICSYGYLAFFWTALGFVSWVYFQFWKFFCKGWLFVLKFKHRKKNVHPFHLFQNARVSARPPSHLVNNMKQCLCFQL